MTRSGAYRRAWSNIHELRSLRSPRVATDGLDYFVVPDESLQLTAGRAADGESVNVFSCSDGLAQGVGGVAKPVVCAASCMGDILAPRW
jgi:hypothetical protein